MLWVGEYDLWREECDEHVQVEVEAEGELGVGIIEDEDSTGEYPS